jgi:hypothetical protein
MGSILGKMEPERNISYFTVSGEAERGKVILTFHMLIQYTNNITLNILFV